MREIIKNFFKRVPRTITVGGKTFYHHGGAAFSKKFRDFILEEAKKEGFQTHTTFTKIRGYQIYIR